MNGTALDYTIESELERGLARDEVPVWSDIVELAQQVGDGGVLGLPLLAARASIAFWIRFLSPMSIVNREMRVVVEELRALDANLAAGEQAPLNARILGSRLVSLGLATRAVASERMGPLGLALDRLADGLIASGLALDSWAN